MYLNYWASCRTCKAVASESQAFAAAHYMFSFQVEYCYAYVCRTTELINTGP